ncbi:MAG: U32 family peptidase [Candidatus Izemoplasmatales bacterium]|jgi:putative protease|nr:U32 family peptidase [bacterium]MDZ4196301.1 U32 family peptidase [Candidatus Izemoplasmatales bacterium]
MSTVELLAPAGDLEKLKVALYYGADAVYIGGTKFSLRARASKFTIDMIEQGVLFAHQLGKKVYVTTNIIPHNEDMGELIEYLQALDKIGVDAIICSSPYIMETAFTHTSLEVHLSTQQSVLNSVFLNYWADLGVSRIVLGREASLDQIRQIQHKSKAELEVFIHGGMCVSYSGKCTLSNTMTSRDANRGGCAHSCRWNYLLRHKDTVLSNGYDFQMASKDLQTIRQIPELIDIGIASLKIEGRMKSIHYIAVVVSTYRELINDSLCNQRKPYEYYENKMAKAENRETSSGFLLGKPSVNQQLYNARSEFPNKEFVGLVEGYADGFLLVEQRNHFVAGDWIEVLSPNPNTQIFQVEAIYDSAGNLLDAARHPMQKIKIKTSVQCQPYDLLRKVSS